MSEKPFKKQFDLEVRKKEADKSLEKHPDFIPVILERGNKCTFQDLPKKK